MTFASRFPDNSIKAVVCLPVLCAVLLSAASAWAQPGVRPGSPQGSPKGSPQGSSGIRGLTITLELPGDREFVVDTANMISDEDEAKIKALADQLLTDKAAPLIVVTIESMAAHAGPGMRIEGFAMLLFNQWGIGYEQIGENRWNYGILLLVSKQDRKARIELGADWGHEKDALCQQIMDELIIPKFKDGDFSGGIVAGADALDKMARELEIPRAPRPMWHYVVGVVFVGLLIFTVVSLIRRGASGWAWLMWGLVFAGVGALLYHMASSRSSGGGFGGGSFGGGFSGGGGASGSW